MLLGFKNYLVFDCGMSVVLIKNDGDDDFQLFLNVGIESNSSLPTG